MPLATLFSTLAAKSARTSPGSNRRDLDYLLHNILDPSAEIPNAYRSSILELKDGRTIAGIILQQDDKTASVITPNETLTIPRSEIETSRESELSLMPEGLLPQFNEDEIRDLIAYLRSPGQVVLERDAATKN